jgi:hypothetical protein
MRALAHLRTSAVAIATILAMLLVPACGSLCATMNHCSTNAASADSDSCHHTNMSAQSDSETQSLSSQAFCGQQAPLVATFVAPESYSQLRLVDAAVAASSIDLTNHVIALDSHRYEFFASSESPQDSIPLENLFVLRI